MVELFDAFLKFGEPGIYIAIIYLTWRVSTWHIQQAKRKRSNNHNGIPQRRVTDGNPGSSHIVELVNERCTYLDRELSELKQHVKEFETEFRAYVKEHVTETKQSLTEVDARLRRIDRRVVHLESKPK